MGLGRINPGCNNCGCVPVPGLEGCELAHEILQPISITLDSPVVSLSGGFIFIPAFGFLNANLCMDAPYIPNLARITRQLSPQNGCSEVILNNYGSNQQGIYFGQALCFESAFWEFSSIGGCRFAFTSFDANAQCYEQNQVGQFAVRLSFGVQPGSRATFISVVLEHSISILRSGECLIDSPLFTGQSGSNYVGTGPSDQRIDFVETGGPGNRSSNAFTERQFVLGGCSFNRPDCGSTDNVCWVHYRMQTSSSYFFYLGDPVYGNQRTFNIWQPNPMIDPWGLFNQPFSATLVLGIG